MSPDAQPQATSSAGSPSWMAPVTPVIPDHELVRRIGGGSYGDVWLARTTVGTWRAVKVVFRDRFTDARPYEREFSGMQKFEPLSRCNEAFVDILQIGRNDADGYFYYVMELADDAAPAAKSDQSSVISDQSVVTEARPKLTTDNCSLNTGLDPSTYVPRTLSKVLLERGRLPVGECVELGLALNLGLAQLHRAGLIHRDIKPSNIIFVGSVPKLADIGLVIDVSEARSFVGTEGFIPPEGPNSPQADLYSLGKVLYEAGMGKDRKDFPEPFTQLAEAPDSSQLLEFNAILLKACAANREERYQSAEEMNADLALLQSGGSVRDQRKMARQLRSVRRAGAIATSLAAVIALGWWWQTRQTAKVRELAAENLQLAKQAEASAELAQKNEASARESLYAADIQLAHQLLQAGNLRSARTLLRNHTPLPGQADLRGFEWRYLWHQSQSVELSSFVAHTNEPRHIALAPDGRRVAVVGQGGTTKIWNLETQKELATLPGTNSVQTLSFSPQGDQLAVGALQEVLVWDARSFSNFTRIPGAGAPAQFSPDGRYLLTGTAANPDATQPSWDNELELSVWEAANWTRLHSVRFPAPGRLARNSTDLYLQLAFGNDPKQVAVLSGDTLRIMSCPDLHEIRLLSEKVQGGLVFFPFLALSPDNRRLVFPSRQGLGVKLWDLVEKRELREFPGHSDKAFAAAFSPDGSMLATCSPDQTVKLWAVDTGECLRTLLGQADEVFDVAFSADGRRLYSLGPYEGELKTWDPLSRPRREILRRPFHPSGFDGLGGLVGFMTPSLQPVVLNLAAMTIAASESPSIADNVGYRLYPCQVSPNGRLLTLHHETNTVQIWDRQEHRMVASLPTPFWPVSFRPDPMSVALLEKGADGLFQIVVRRYPEGIEKWRLNNSSLFGTYPFADAPLGYLLTQEEEPSGGSRVHVRHLEGDRLKTVFTRLDTKAYGGGALSPDGRLLALSAGDITLVEVPSGNTIGVLRGHTRKGVLVAFSPDGRTLASMADDRTVRLWHVATQRELMRFEAPEEDYSGYMLEFSPDGRALATFRQDSQGQVTWLHFAPSLAEIAAAEGGDYAPLAGKEAALHLAVAETLQQRSRFEEALRANTEALALSGPREKGLGLELVMRRQRLSLLKNLGLFEEAAAENLGLLNITRRDPATPPGAIDLSAFYNHPLAEPTPPTRHANDLSELPQGIQTLAGTVFDLRGRLYLHGPSPERPWPLEPASITGIPIRRRLDRLHFLHACGYENREIKTGDRIGQYRLHYADGRIVEVPIRFNVDTTDWWEVSHLPSELPEAVLAWRGSNPRRRSEGKDGVRLFKRTWQNPHPETEVTFMDFVAEHPKTHPVLVALTAE